MAKNINHLQHVKSSVVEEGLPKLPQASVLVEGEIAVNYAKDYETLSIKNSSGEVVTFSSDYYYTEKKLGSGFTNDNSGLTVTQALNDTEQVIAAALNDLNERKLDTSALTQSLSGFVTTEEFDESELVTSAALNDLNSRIIEISGNTSEIDLSDYYTKTEVDEKLGSGFTSDNSANTVTSIIEENELITAAALNDLDSRKLDASAYTPSDFVRSVSINGDSKNGNVAFSSIASGTTVNGELKTSNNNGVIDLGNLTSAVTMNGDSKQVNASGVVDLGVVVSAATLNNSAQTITNGTLQMSLSANYDSNAKKIYLKSGSATISEIDATDFIKDGMVNNVDVSSVTSGATEVECLVISFNTDAGKEDINIPLTDIFDSSLYYTKTEIDNKLGSGFSGDNSGLTVTQALNDTEQVIAAALNDLNSRKLDTSALTESLSGFVTTAEFNESELVTSAALNDLNSRKLDASAYTPTDLSEYATMDWVNDERLGSAFTESSVTQVLYEDELIIAAALTDLDDRVSANTLTIQQVNAKADNTAAALSGYTPSGYSYSKTETDNKLATKLDTSAFTETISGYVTTEEFDDKLGYWFSGSTTDANFKSVTQVIRENEQAISASLNDLNSRINTISADTSSIDLTQYYTKDEIDDSELVIASSLNDLNSRKLDASALTEVTDYVDEKLGSGFTSGLTVTQAIEENELAIAAALNDLDSRIKNVSSVTESIDLSQYYTKTDVNNALGSAFTPSNYVSSVTDVVKENELIVSSALNDLNSRVLTLENIDNTYVSAGTYDSANSKIVIYQAHGPIVEVTGITAGGGSGGSGDTNVIEVVKVSGTALTPDSNKAVDITSVPASIVTQDATHRFVSDTEKTTWNAVTSKTDTTAFTAHTGDSTVHVTAANKTQWNNAISGVSFNGTTATVSNHVAAITATIPAAANNATITLQFGNSSSAFTVNASSNLTINLATLIGIPAPTASDNGKILGVVNGAFAWVTPTTIYTGSGTPSSSQGNNGDIYLQTS